MRTVTRHASASPFESTVGFCRALRLGDRILVSGSAPLGEDGRTVNAGDAYAQARRCLDIIASALCSLGGAEVVRTRVFFTRREDWPEIARAHAEAFPVARPVSTFVVVSGLLDPAWLVEIEAEAAATGEDDSTAAWRTVEAINSAWTSGRVDELRGLFHERMVAMTPAEPERLDGREACLASWRRFVEKSRIHTWRTWEPRVQLYGDTAVVSYYYELRCEIDGAMRDLRGRDLFTLVREDGRWRAVADQFSGFPGEDG